MVTPVLAEADLGTDDDGFSDILAQRVYYIIVAVMAVLSPLIAAALQAYVRRYCNTNREAQNGAGEAQNGAGEAQNGAAEAQNGAGEAQNGAGEAQNGADEAD